jgi:hypothetical protein
MGRNVRALRHVAEIAQVALLDDLRVVGLRHAVDFHRLAVVDEVEERGERLAQAHATAAAVADVEHPLHFLLDRRLVVELRTRPVERMARGREEVAFAGGHRRAERDSSRVMRASLLQGR